MPPLKALLLSDGRPGHFRLAEAVLLAVARRRPVEIERRDCRRGRWPGRLLAGLSNSTRLDDAILSRIYGLEPPQPGAYDLVVSAGAETLAANIACARRAKASNVFYGSLRAFRPDSFSLVLTSYVRNAGHPRHAMMMKPSALPWPTKRPAAVGGTVAPKVAVLLLGGDAGTTAFARPDWGQLLAFVAASHAAHGTRWIISNSRRTPTAISDQLATGLAAPHQLIDVREPAAPPLAQAFAAAEAVICTDDSSTMISEAIAAGLPTIGARPARHTLPLDEAGYRAYLVDNHWHRVVDIAALTPARFLAELAQIRPLQQDPLEQLAALLVERLPQLYTGGV
jgi:uncharacterized protein